MAGLHTDLLYVVIPLAASSPGYLKKNRRGKRLEVRTEVVAQRDKGKKRNKLTY